MNTSLRFAWRNIWRYPRRTILTILAITFGSGLLVFSVGLQLGSYDMMIANSVRVFHGFLQVQAEGYLDQPRMRTSIPAIQPLAKQIRSTLADQQIAARAAGFAMVSSAQRTTGVPVFGVEPEFEPQVSTIPGLVKQGRYLSSSEANEAVIGSSLAKNLQLNVGDEITLLGSGRDGSVAATIMPIVGIYTSGSKDLDRALIQIPLVTFQQVFSMHDHGHMIVVSGDDINDLPALMLQVQQQLAVQQGLVAHSWEALQPGLKQAIELDYASGWITYIVLVLIITFSILNTFLMSVLERQREFGIMLALGYKPFQISTLVMLETFVLTIVALLIGTAIGLAVNIYYYYTGFTMAGFEELAQQFNMPPYITPQISWTSITRGPLVILACTLLVALYPALKVLRLRPVDAMRTI